MQSQQSVTRNDQIIGPGRSNDIRTIILFMQTRGPQGRGESRGFCGPVLAYGCGCDHQCGSACGPVQQQGQGLNGFTQPHVVGQTGASTPMRQACQPDKPIELVGTQIGTQG